MTDGTAAAGRYGRIVGRLLAVLPGPARRYLVRHREVLKFLVVGGTCFVITVVVNYALKLTVLHEKPIAALTIATMVATGVSYVLNREWSFKTRGGRQRHHEAILFFGISAVGIVVNDIPMWIARYALDLRVPDVSRLSQEVSDFVAGIILGTLLAMAFRLWAFRRWVFPHADARPGRTLVPFPADPDESRAA
ncbi:GtrA family protein [Couchioplanes caeruleus]|uniref:GtrA family protein n=1 Tax=Couchioplanes caeruleus TaxID=56438 RepID=UPI0020BE11BA|nr:GtrA family protein [Couchioplanes caeruleus]UQU66595.1 GtrA family protein [Couchioplanes caeruleus]